MNETTSLDVAVHTTLLGIDHSRASVAEREHLRYDAGATTALLRKTASIEGLREAAVLSTCNRTEFYLVGPSDACDRFLELVRLDRPGARPHSPECRLERMTGDAVARHLCEVASGVASLILGDAFILRQMKEAQALASQAGSLGPVLSQLFRLAFATGREARSRTEIARGETGLGAVVATAILQHGRRDPRVLLIGAGDTARDIARQIAKRRVGVLRIVNRTGASASELARMYGGQAAGWESLGAELAAADVVVCATSAPEPIVGPEALAGLSPLLIDVGVPRNISAPPGAACLVVDDLVARQDDACSRREGAVSAVMAIVDEAVSDWRAWVQARTLEAGLKTLFMRETEVRRQIVADLMEHGWRGPQEQAEMLVARRTSVLLKRHAAEMRQWARSLRTEYAGVHD